MINSHFCIRCFIYIFFCYTTVEGSSPVIQSPDHRPGSPTVKSSPFAHNGTEQLYSEWSKWTSCSSTCGLGIITRTRTCLKSAYNSRGVSVPLCHAEYSEHKICKLKECPIDAPQARDILCSHHNNRTVAGKLVMEWTPVNSGLNPCELRCKAEPDGLEYGFGKVSNGTPCPQGVCLDGRCLKIGCDDRLGSEVILDMCGVCGGRNASCVHYKDVYMGQPTADSERRNGYHEVVVLPVGARNLIIRQLVGKNYLALQDRTRGIIFNGEHHLTKYGGHYPIAGTLVQFEKSDNTSEILTAKGPVTEELYILVLLRNFNQGIYYEYWLPKQTHNPSRAQFPIRRSENSFTTTSTKVTPISPTAPSNSNSHYRPTKPAFAYGFGEKPFKSQDAPVFRHFTTSTTSNPRYKASVPFPYSAPYRSAVYTSNNNNNNNNNNGAYKKDVNILYKPRTFNPSDYYQTFRNTSVVDFKKISDLDKELPVLTQPDSSGSNGRRPYDNIIPNTVLDEKKHETNFPKKPLKTTIEINKRGEKSNKFVTNGRLKYSLQDTDEVYINTSGRFTPEPLSIALLPLPDEDGVKSNNSRQKGGVCAPCERSRDQTKHFCESDFVIRAEVLGYEFLHDETRYELEVRQTFKNTLSLLTREYVWSPDTCRCPKLRIGKEYVIMGRIDNNYRKRESRLLVDKTCFVRTFNLKYARRLQKLRKDHAKKCMKTS